MTVYNTVSFPRNAAASPGRLRYSALRVSKLPQSAAKARVEETKRYAVERDRGKASGQAGIVSSHICAKDMGASHSRTRPGAGPAKVSKAVFGPSAVSPSPGYFILSLKGDRIKVVNASSGELKVLTAIIKRHCRIVKSGWDRHLTFSYRLKKAERHSMIQLVADILLTLYQAGWEPMTPIDMGVKSRDSSSGVSPQTAICFRNKEDGHQDREAFGSNFSISGLGRDVPDNSCLCLETYQSNYLGFLDVSNTVLYELVTTIQHEWLPGIRGVSMAVSSVISDYSQDMPPVLPPAPLLEDAKYLQLTGTPWSAEALEGRDLEDSICAENLQLSIIACLARQGYKLSMSINMDASSRVFFFIKDPDATKVEIRLPNLAGAGLGEKDTLSVYRPMITRSKSSFFRNYNGRTRSLRSRIRASLRKKAVNKGKAVAGGGSNGGAVMSYKPQVEQAWWQQTSTDVSSDHDCQ